MLVLRKQACIRIISGVTFFPGLNGEIPEKILQNETFKQEVELGVMEILSKEKGIEKEQAKVEEVDEQIVASVLSAKPNNAIKLVRNTLKIKTIEALAEKETRQPVLAAIEEQRKLLFVELKVEPKKEEEKF
jgi:hypothetical protein